MPGSTAEQGPRSTINNTFKTPSRAGQFTLGKGTAFRQSPEGEACPRPQGTQEYTLCHIHKVSGFPTLRNSLEIPAPGSEVDCNRRKKSSCRIPQQPANPTTSAGWLEPHSQFKAFWRVYQRCACNLPAQCVQPPHRPTARGGILGQWME